MYNLLCITGENHTLTAANLSETNFKIILYINISRVNAVKILDEYI